MSELLEDIRKYWTKRAKGYSEYNQGELSGEQREKWRQAILAELPDKPLTEIHRSSPVKMEICLCVVSFMSVTAIPGW